MLIHAVYGQSRLDTVPQVVQRNLWPIINTLERTGDADLRF